MQDILVLLISDLTPATAWQHLESMRYDDQIMDRTPGRSGTFEPSEEGQASVHASEEVLDHGEQSSYLQVLDETLQQSTQLLLTQRQQLDDHCPVDIQLWSRYIT